MSKVLNQFLLNFVIFYLTTALFYRIIGLYKKPIQKLFGGRNKNRDTNTDTTRGKNPVKWKYRK